MGERICEVQWYRPSPICTCFWHLHVIQVEDRVEDLKRQYDEKLKMKDELRISAETLALKLKRAGQLVEGLAGERERWKESVKVRCMGF